MAETSLSLNELETSATGCVGEACHRTPSVGSESAIIIGVLIPAVIIMIGLGVVLVIVWRRSRAEALEDDDPMFYGETEYLPDAETIDLYSSDGYDGTRNKHRFSEVSYKPPEFAGLRTQGARASARSSQIDGFILPDDMMDTDTLRNFVRAVEGTEYDGYKVAENSSRSTLPKQVASARSSKYQPRSSQSSLVPGRRHDLRRVRTRSTGDRMSQVFSRSYPGDMMMHSYSVYNTPNQYNPNMMRRNRNNNYGRISMHENVRNCSTGVNSRPSSYMHQGFSASESIHRKTAADNPQYAYSQEDLAMHRYTLYNYIDVDDIPSFSSTFREYPPTPQQISKSVSVLPVLDNSNCHNKEKPTPKKPQKEEEENEEVARGDTGYATSFLDEKGDGIDRIKSIYQIYFDSQTTTNLPKGNDESDDIAKLQRGQRAPEKTPKVPEKALVRNSGTNHNTGKLQKNDSALNQQSSSAKLPSNITQYLPDSAVAASVSSSVYSPVKSPSYVLSTDNIHSAQVNHYPNSYPTQQSIMSRSCNQLDNPELYQYTPNSSYNSFTEPPTAKFPGGAKLPHHLRNSISMMHPMTLGQKINYKPAGSIRQLYEVFGGPNQHGYPVPRLSSLLDYNNSDQARSLTVLPTGRSQDNLRKQLE
ncbi:HBL256Wp [Eremothecium sinecaudum]|uniref:HBL256Wp n=1 Tax=Eremothecium sinecaudum TaxID=45286 RepID=A0A120K0T6_9SACH|nr:HBL256Wp [Eremothecium sinecaudum]AMD18646.1 HBL256Wp [Eremothecium sinecaudum]